MRQRVGSGRGPRRSERGTAAKRSPARRTAPGSGGPDVRGRQPRPCHSNIIRQPDRGGTEAGPEPRLDETSADGWRLLVEYEPDRYETTSAYALFHFQM